MSLKPLSLSAFLFFISNIIPPFLLLSLSLYHKSLFKYSIFLSCVVGLLYICLCVLFFGLSVIPKFYPIIQALFAMRLAEFIVLLCLFSLAFVGSDAVVRMTMLTATNGAKERKSSNETVRNDYLGQWLFITLKLLIVKISISILNNKVVHITISTKI